MDLPDCPPGAEGYEDTVVSLPSKKIDVDEKPSTKAELEFQQHLNSLKIKVENGQYRCMVERRGRDSAGKWIYLCFPCAAMCSGEAILQTHLSGKKHKTKLSVKTVWPVSIFDEHPYYKEKENKSVSGKSTQASPMTPYELEKMYEKKRTVRCHIQDAIDGLKCPLLGLEYLIEYPPEESHHEPSYLCTLCMKQGAPRTIINHLTCFSHRYTFLGHNFPKAIALLGPYRVQRQYRQGVNVVIERLVSRVESKFGRLKPVNIDKEEYERDKEFIHQWIFNGFHFNESSGSTFEEVVDIGLLQSLSEEGENKVSRDPSPPKVPVPRPVFNKFTRPVGRQERRGNSINSLSDISDDEGKPKPPSKQHQAVVKSQRYHPYEKTRDPEPKSVDDKTHRPPNYQYKVNMAKSQQENAEENANKMLAYHEKNPEKHPLYPEEWKKFWNRRYKEIQAEGKDPSKHDFKPEWIVYWTSRMKELHNEELRVIVNEIYRKLRLTPPDTRVVDLKKHSPEPKSKLEPRRRSPESRRRSIDRKLIDRRRTPERRRSPDLHRRSPDRHRRSPPRFVDRRYSPVRRRSPERRRSPPRRKSPDLRRRSPERFMHDVRKRSVERRRSPERRYDNRRSPARTFINLDSIRRSRSPLSLREDSLRNKSPTLPKPQEILVSDVSDDDLKPAPSNLSPWNSDIESIESIPESRSPIARSRTESVASSRRKEPRHHGHVADPKDLGPAENVVATLRLLVALEDHLGSLGPKIVDLLAEALKMEKEEANSSEQLLCRESALTLLETGKERLKGAVQAGLVGGAAAAAARAAVVRVAATLHYAETRLQKTKVKAPEVVPVAGVGAVDREQIALQMAAALVQQGKCDVSKQELEQLVDAVVGMAEAKKREAEGNRSVELKLKEVAAPQSQGASALQLLQSAYDENEKKPDRDEATEAMDRLSDSDLETLLKNFNELSAEEQHSLIAYLKKLEAKEPSRVERLRQYVSATVPIPQAPVEPEPEQKETNVMVIPSDDDDDYTVEEVFKSATEKVKENQIRQEMEVVKKSLETKSESASLVSNVVDISKNLSSATDLFALVQASLKSTAANAATTASAEVVSRTLQPRSFGDAQPLLADPKPTPLIPNLTSVSSEYAQPPPSKQTEEYGQPPPSNYNDNQPTDSFNQNQGHQWDINPQQWDNQGPAFNQNQSRNNQNQGWNNNQGSTSWNNQDKNWNDNQGQNWDKSNQEQPWDNNQGWNKQGGGNWNNQDANWDNQGSNWDNQESNNNWNNQGPSRDMNQGRNFNNQVPVWDNQKQDRCPHRGNFNQDNFNRGGGRGGHFVNGKNDNRNNQNHNFRGNRGGRGNFGQRGRGRGRGM